MSTILTKEGNEHCLQDFEATRWLATETMDTNFDCFLFALHGIVSFVEWVG